MGCIIAFIGQDECRAYLDASDVPEGATYFSSPEELSRSASLEALDKVREKLLGPSIGRSSTVLEAAERLWYVLSLGAPSGPSWGKWERRRDKLGNFKMRDKSRIELLKLNYVPGADYMADHFYKIQRLQAKKILQFFIDDGRGIWDNDEAYRVLLSRIDELGTKHRDIEQFWKFFKTELIRWKLLKRVKYAELAANPELSESPTQEGDATPR